MLHALPAGQAAVLTGRTFFPALISGPFGDGITVVFTGAATMALAAAASWLRGGRPAAEEWETPGSGRYDRAVGGAGMGASVVPGGRARSRPR